MYELRSERGDEGWALVARASSSSHANTVAK